MNSYYQRHREQILDKNKVWYNQLKQDKTTEEWKAYRLGKTIAQQKYRLKNKDKINANRQKGTAIYKKQQSYRRNNLLNFNGKNIRIKKREYFGKCEICGINKEFVKYNYHHWDDTNPAKGIWVCCRCHTVVEGVERNIHNKYFNLKDQVEQLFNMHKERSNAI